MIHHFVNKGMTKSEAMQHSEYDFWESLMHDNLQSKREKYLLKKK